MAAEFGCTVAEVVAGREAWLQLTESEKKKRIKIQARHDRESGRQGYQDAADMFFEDASEEVRDFRVIDKTFLLILRWAAREQTQPHHKRAIEFAADLIERIAKRGYPPPTSARRERLDKYRKLDRAWSDKAKTETVEEFCNRVALELNVSPQTVRDHKYRPKKVV